MRMANLLIWLFLSYSIILKYRPHTHTICALMASSNKTKMRFCCAKAISSLHFGKLSLLTLGFQFYSQHMVSSYIFLQLVIIRQRDKLEPWFKHFLVEDRGLGGSASYVDFLCHMHKEIRSLLSWCGKSELITPRVHHQSWWWEIRNEEEIQIW